MARFLKSTGIIVWIFIIAYSFIYLYRNTLFLEDFLKITGALAILSVICYVCFQMIWGKKWVSEGVATVFIGNSLINAFELFLNELPKPSKSTTANLAGHLIYRLTRIGLFGILLAAIPLILLWQQNNLLSLQNEKIERQNELFDFQNRRVDEQTDLLQEQNTLVVTQIELLDAQNDLTNKQNTLFAAQNLEVQDQTLLLDAQNKKLDIQTALSESNRRSTLIIMMSNIMDKVDEELKNDWGKDNIANLSPQLIARIVALSKSFRPYHFLNEGKLTDKMYSPERGQLLMALSKVGLSDETYKKIFEGASFEYAYLEKADLQGMYLGGINLASANLKGANLSATQLSNAILINSNLEEADLSMASLRGASLMDAKFKRTGFNGTLLIDAMVSDTNWLTINDQKNTINVLGTIAEKYFIDTTVNKFDDYYQFNISSEQYNGYFFHLRYQDTSKIETIINSHNTLIGNARKLLQLQYANSFLQKEKELLQERVALKKLLILLLQSNGGEDL